MSFLFSPKPAALCRGAIYRDNTILAAIRRDLGPEYGFAVFLGNAVADVAGYTIQIHRIVEAIADDADLPDT